MNKPAAPLWLSRTDRDTLAKWARSAAAPYRVVTQAKALLMAGDGVANSRIASRLGISRPTVLQWRSRFRSDGLDSVGDVRAGRGRKPAMTESQVQAMVQATVEETPPGAARWSLRSMARVAGVSQSTVQRVWDMHGLQPHRATALRSSTAGAFVAQLTEVVGLYLSSRDNVAVLSVDERSQIAALDHPQAGPPTMWGYPGATNPGYERDHTATLLDTLNGLASKVVGQRHGRQRHQEFLKFLRRVDRSFPRKLVLHVLLDHHGTHDREGVRKWLAAHSRFRLHVTPKGALWLDLVESWVTGLAQHVHRGAFCSVTELVAAIRDYSRHDDADAGPFVWSTTLDAVFERAANPGATLETSR